MGFIKIFKSLFKLSEQDVKKEIKQDVKKEIKQKVKKPRRYIKDVLPGENIRIEWHRIKGRIGFVNCISNDPETEKIFLKVQFSNYKELNLNETEYLILDYNSEELKNFHLLNEHSPRLQVEEKSDKKDNEDSNIVALQAKLNLALSEERFEDADYYQKKIDKLVNNKL